MEIAQVPKMCVLGWVWVPWKAEWEGQSCDLRAPGLPTVGGKAAVSPAVHPGPPED